MRKLRPYGSVRGRGSIHDGKGPAYSTEKKAVEEDKLKRFKPKKEIDYIRREIINELVVYYDSMVGKNTHESFDHFLRISILYEQLDKLEEQGLTKYLANQKDIREILIPNQSETHRNKLVYKLLATENTGSENETEIIKEIKDMIYKSYNFEALIDMLNAKLEFPIVKPPCQELLDLYNGYRSNFDSLTNNDDPPSSLVEKVVVKLTDSFFEHMQEIQKENTNQSLRVFNDYAKRIIASHIEDEIERYFAQEHNELLAVHSINNLTLLRNYENGEIGNEYFINKKKRIQQFLKEGTVIPYSTLLVFLDLYSDIESISTAEKWQWLPRSRDKYFNELVEQITTFFKDENV